MGIWDAKPGAWTVSQLVSLAGVKMFDGPTGLDTILGLLPGLGLAPGHSPDLGLAPISLFIG